MNNIQKQKGITLIALVITIIVLIILAGVGINLTLGDNGILRRAQDAQKLSDKATVKEKVEVAIVDALIVFCAKEFGGIDISGTVNGLLDVLLPLLVAFGIVNNPTDKSHF